MSDIAQRSNSQADFPELGKDDEKEELVEKEIRARFKKMCEGYFDNVAKKLVIEHKVCTGFSHLLTMKPNYT